MIKKLLFRVISSLLYDSSMNLRQTFDALIFTKFYNLFYIGTRFHHNVIGLSICYASHDVRIHLFKYIIFIHLSFFSHTHLCVFFKIVDLEEMRESEHISLIYLYMINSNLFIYACLKRAQNQIFY